MSVERQEATPNTVGSAPLPARRFGASLWRRLLPRLETGRLIVQLPSGREIVLAGDRSGPEARLLLRRWRGAWRLATGGDVGFADAYADSDVSSPDLTALLTLAARNWTPANEPAHWRLPHPIRSRRHRRNRNTEHGSKRNIEAHYDLGNDFFAQWLDPTMNYSSALYLSPEQTLEEAQTAKLDRVIDRLALSGGERVLEIGCGWGALAERLLERSDATLVGITLSPRQLAYARERLAARGLEARSDLRLEDYRAVEAQFDRIVSIEMLEAVGEDYWPVYFEKLAASLRPGGIAVVQAITIAEDRFDEYRRRPDFIQKYIFPGGMLPTVAILRREVAAAGLHLDATEFMGASYARTLAAWQRRFQAAWPAIRKQGFDERFKRIWEYYLAYCEAGFASGAIDVAQYRIRKPSR
jgi:cyclopropane-fatty-acyl-phospholipid synthase